MQAGGDDTDRQRRWIKIFNDSSNSHGQGPVTEPRPWVSRSGVLGTFELLPYYLHSKMVAEADSW